jgi:hypothetical protein
MNLRKVIDGAVDQPNPVVAARTVSRATRIVGEMLEEMAETRTIFRQPAAWVYWSGTLLWGIVEVAVPHSLWRVFWHHWTRLLFVLSAVLILLGFIPWAAPVQRVGIVLLVLTVIAELIVLSLNYWMRAKSWVRPLLWLPLMTGVAGAGWFWYSLRTSGAPVYHLCFVLSCVLIAIAWAGIVMSQTIRRFGGLWSLVSLLVLVVAVLEVWRNGYFYLAYYQNRLVLPDSAWPFRIEIATAGLALLTLIYLTVLALLLFGVRQLKRVFSRLNSICL